jgi:hypothetical protein
VRFRRKPPAGHELLEAEFLVATVDHGPGAGGRVDEHDLAPAVRSLTDGSDRQVLPVFTNEYALRGVYPQGSAWVRVPFPEILRLFAGGDWEAIVVDPEHEPAQEISRSDAERLLADVV